MNGFCWRNTQVIVPLLLCDSSRSSCLFSVSTNAVNLEKLTHKCFFFFPKKQSLDAFWNFSIFFKPCRVLEQEEHRHFLGKSSTTFSVPPWDSTFFYWACNRSALHLGREETLNGMPVRSVSLEAGIMSHFIIRSGPKSIPEGQTLCVTSLDPTHQHSVVIFLGQGQDAGQPLPQFPFSPQKHITFMVRAPCVVEHQDSSTEGAEPPLTPFSARPSVAQGKEIAGAHHFLQPPPRAAACILPLWHCRIAPCVMQLERPLPTEEARRSSWNAGTLLSALLGIKTLGFYLIFILYHLRWLTVSS